MFKVISWWIQIQTKLVWPDHNLFLKIWMSRWNSKQKKSACVCLFVCFFPYGISGCISFPKPSRGQKEHFAIHLIWLLEGWEAAFNANMNSPLCLSVCAQRIVCVGFICRVFQGNILITREITEIFKPQISPNPTLGSGRYAFVLPKVWPGFEVPENQASSMWD